MFDSKRIYYTKFFYKIKNNRLIPNKSSTRNNSNIVYCQKCTDPLTIERIRRLYDMSLNNIRVKRTQIMIRIDYPQNYSTYSIKSSSGKNIPLTFKLYN